MRNGTFCLLILLSASAFAQTAATQMQRHKARLEQELRNADLAFAKATAERRLEGWMDFFADDAAILQGGKAITGKQNIRRFYEPVFANKDFSLTWTPTHAEAAIDGTMGYTYGAYEARNGEHVSHGMYLTIWRKSGGRWLVVMDTGSAAPQPSPQKEGVNRRQRGAKTLRLIANSPLALYSLAHENRHPRSCVPGVAVRVGPASGEPEDL